MWDNYSIQLNGIMLDIVPKPDIMDVYYE